MRRMEFAEGSPFGEAEVSPMRVVGAGDRALERGSPPPLPPPPSPSRHPLKRKSCFGTERYRRELRVERIPTESVGSHQTKSSTTDDILNEHTCT